MIWSAKLGSLIGLSRTRPTLPTADYYLLGALSQFVNPHRRPDESRPIARAGPNTWVCGRRLVIVRYVTDEELGWIEPQSWTSIHYVIDDLITAATRSLELPADYRERLDLFCQRMLPRILALDPVIVAPSRAVLDQFPGLVGKLLQPTCLALCGGGSLPEPTIFDGRLDVAFLGTRSHSGSLPLLDSIGAGLDRSLPSARLHLFFGRHLPPELASRRSIVNHAPLPWGKFREFARKTRFHVGLAPVQGTPFAMARSVTKLMDHATFGAAGLYSRRAPFADVIESGADGLLVEDTPEAWIAAITRLGADPALMARLAKGGIELASRIGNPETARNFWKDELKIGPA